MTTRNLTEAANSAKELSGNKWRAKLISADAWGSSGYYSSEVLKRDGARVFHEGLQMHQDHPSADEAWQRPERSVSTLVGKLETAAVFEDDPEFGPGLYAEVSFYPSYVDRMREIGKDVGLSIHAEGLTENAERDGRVGPVVTGLLSAKSVDVVTQAGAGGRLTSILESNTGLAGTPITSKENQSMTDVTKEDLDALAAKFDELPGLFAAALKDANLGAPAVVASTEPTAASTVPTSTSTSTATDTSTAVAPVIDHAGIVEALRVNKLPGAVAGFVVDSILKGKTLEDAIKTQVELREAFASTGTTNVQGAMVLREAAAGTPGAGGELTGFERALARLGKPIATTKGMN